MFQRNSSENDWYGNSVELSIGNNPDSTLFASSILCMDALETRTNTI